MKQVAEQAKQVKVLVLASVDYVSLELGGVSLEGVAVSLELGDVSYVGKGFSTY